MRFYVCLIWLWTVCYEAVFRTWFLPGIYYPGPGGRLQENVQCFFKCFSLSLFLNEFCGACSWKCSRIFQLTHLTEDDTEQWVWFSSLILVVALFEATDKHQALDVLKFHVLEIDILTSTVYCPSVANSVFDQLQTVETLVRSWGLCSKENHEDFDGVRKFDMFKKLRRNLVDVPVVWRHLSGSWHPNSRASCTNSRRWFYFPSEQGNWLKFVAKASRVCPWFLSISCASFGKSSAICNNAIALGCHSDQIDISGSFRSEHTIYMLLYTK